jgi:hypothetical protein
MVLRSATLLLDVGVETDGLRVAAWVVPRVHAEVEFSHQGVEAAVT